MRNVISYYIYIIKTRLYPKRLTLELNRKTFLKNNWSALVEFLVYYMKHKQYIYILYLGLFLFNLQNALLQTIIQCRSNKHKTKIAY